MIVRLDVLEQKIVADEANLLAEDRVLTAERGLRRVEPMEDAPDPGKRLGLRRVDPSDAGARVRAPQDAHEEHPRQVDVLGVDGLPGDPLGAVDAAPSVGDLGALRAVELR